MKSLAIWTIMLALLPSAAAGSLSVFVSVLPQKYFVQQIGGSQVEVHVLVGSGQSPATFEPKPRQLSALAQADLYYRIGVPFEQALMPRIGTVNPKLSILDARDGIELRPVGPGEDAHGHAADGTGMDPHIWLDPARVRLMLGPLRDRLMQLDPDHSAIYQQNYRRFSAQLLQLEQDIRQQLDVVENGRFMVFHPSWGYFADAFGLRQIAIEFEGKSPGSRRLAELIELARQEQIKRLFVQPQFASSQARALATAIGAKVVLLDPLAEEYMANMRLTARLIREAME